MTDSQSKVKYPNIKVKLVGEDGNAFAILGAVKNAMRRGKASDEDIQAFLAEAMSGDYNHLLQTCMRFVVVA
jgi:hypothetical protein